MKIINSIRSIYDSQFVLNEKLKIQVDNLFINIKENQWHYISRLKKPESFALKLETGRISDPTKMEDFFACTIVVENVGAIKNAKKMVSKHFKIDQERPTSDDFTQKDSASFIFDDLRLYVKLKPTIARTKGPINDIIFEIQIKTFLQHAWAVATHDLVYKSDQISWTKQRVAFQIKAMLENAEVSIEKADSVKSLKGIPSNNPKVQFQNEIKEFLLKHFDRFSLPDDIVRLVGNIETLIKVLNFTISDIEECLVVETAKGFGTNTLNLSPYLIIIQSIINQKTSHVKKVLKKKIRSSYAPKLFIPIEVDTTQIADSLPSEKVVR